MSCSRNLCIIPKKCIYADSIHMHAKINGISVVLKMAEFDSGLRLAIGDALMHCGSKKLAKRSRTKSRCCAECKCGSGDYRSRNKCVKTTRKHHCHKSCRSRDTSATKGLETFSSRKSSRSANIFWKLTKLKKCITKTCSKIKCSKKKPPSQIANSCRSKNTYVERIKELEPTQLESELEPTQSSLRSCNICVRLTKVEKCTPKRPPRPKIVCSDKSVQAQIEEKCPSIQSSSCRSREFLVKLKELKCHCCGTSLSCRSKDTDAKTNKLKKCCCQTRPRRRECTETSTECQTISSRSSEISAKPKELGICPSQSFMRSCDYSEKTIEYKNYPSKSSSSCRSTKILLKSKESKTHSSEKCFSSRLKDPCVEPKESETCISKTSSRHRETCAKHKYEKESHESRKPRTPSPKRDKPYRRKKSYCVFKRNPGLLSAPKKRRKPEEPKKRRKPKKAETVYSVSTESVKRRGPAHKYRPPKKDRCPPCPPCKPAKREKSPPSREKVRRGTFNKKREPVKKLRLPKNCNPVFVNAGTSTGSTNVAHQYNMQNDQSGFEMKHQIEPAISGDTEKTICSILDLDNIASFEGNLVEKKDSGEVKYRFIAYNLKESLSPESVTTSISTGTRDCLETTLSIYAPSISSMVPKTDSHEILSTIVDHATALKDEKSTETSTFPSIAYSTSTSAQTCLIDYELFTGNVAKTKVFRKDYVIEETFTNESISLKTDSPTS
ncbi:uncharacterized protein [Halyomorpha halys]|uniref:uncharacterized protein isoform X3 n=1 Tax=Halyomorpha halys TaxID=286706 RepID=UPI000D0C7C10|nr:serine/arginine repetitive matrix protein 1-like isoform X3 [Halyomorpha halys]